MHMLAMSYHCVYDFSSHTVVCGHFLMALALVFSLSPRLKGNELFKQGKYAEAAVFYRKGLYYSVFDDSQVRSQEAPTPWCNATLTPLTEYLSLQFNFELHDEHRESVIKTVVPLRLNYALCLLKDDYKPLRKPLPSLDGR